MEWGLYAEAALATTALRGGFFSGGVGEGSDWTEEARVLRLLKVVVVGKKQGLSDGGGSSGGGEK